MHHHSLSSGLENIVSVAQKPHKTLLNLFELNINNETTKLLLQIFAIPQNFHFPVYSTNFLEIQEQFIDQSGTLNLVLESFLVDLASEIDQRQRGNEHSYFQEAEIWKVLILGVAGLSELHLRGRNYGNLDLGAFVRVEDQDIFAKMVPKEIFEVNEENLREGNQIYFSLEELRGLKSGRPAKTDELLENDIFHFGLALLEMSTFISVSSCYDLENLKIDFRFLEKKLEIVENKYSKELAFLIKIMLNVDKKLRPTIKELAILLKKFDVLEGFIDKQEVHSFIQQNLKTNICGKCVNKIRKTKDEAIYGGRSEGSSFGEGTQRYYLENEKEWLNLQRSLTKDQGKNSRSALKSLENYQY